MKVPAWRGRGGFNTTITRDHGSGGGGGNGVGRVRRRGGEASK